MHPHTDRLAIARRTVLTPGLVATLRCTTESAWGMLKTARGQPIDGERAARLIPNHDIRRPGSLVLIPIDKSPAIGCAEPAARPARVGVAGQLARRMLGDSPTGGDAA